MITFHHFHVCAYIYIYIYINSKLVFWQIWLNTVELSFLMILFCLFLSFSCWFLYLCQGPVDKGVAVNSSKCFRSFRLIVFACGGRGGVLLFVGIVRFCLVWVQIYFARTSRTTEMLTKASQQ